MIVTELFHLAIKTSNLPATVKFWTEIIGLKEIERPAFNFPGSWLATPGPTGKLIVHIYAGGPALGPSGQVDVGTGAIDHVSLVAFGYHDFIAQLKKYDLEWREFEVPGGAIWQLFVYDPSGVLLELSFDGTIEQGARPDMSAGRGYLAGESFFDPNQNRRLS